MFAFKQEWRAPLYIKLWFEVVLTRNSNLHTVVSGLFNMASSSTHVISVCDSDSDAATREPWSEAAAAAERFYNDQSGWLATHRMELYGPNQSRDQRVAALEDALVSAHFLYYEREGWSLRRHFGGCRGESCQCCAGQALFISDSAKFCPLCRSAELPPSICPLPPLLQQPVSKSASPVTKRRRTETTSLKKTVNPLQRELEKGRRQPIEDWDATMVLLEGDSTTTLTHLLSNQIPALVDIANIYERTPLYRRARALFHYLDTREKEFGRSILEQRRVSREMQAMMREDRSAPLPLC